MPDKKQQKKDTEHGGEDDIVFEEEGETAAQSLKKLREKLKACNKERQEYLSGWQRARADLQNTKREKQDEVSRARNKTIQQIVHDILPVLDSFSMAFSNKEVWEQAPENWRDGVTHIYNQLWSTLREYGVEEINPAEGEGLDPKMHSSVEAQPADDEAKDQQIARVIQKGYKMKDEVIRPARVVVYQYK